jgi:hypothetical protein
MKAPGKGSVANRVSQAILFIAAVAGFLAAVASAPAAPTEDGDISAQIVKSRPAAAAPRDPAIDMRPLGRGPTIKVARAFDAEDEDCTLAITKVKDESGQVHVKRGVTCAN